MFRQKLALGIILTILVLNVWSFSIPKVESQTLNPPFTLQNASTWLTTPTYDGSGQVIHADIVKVEKVGILPSNFKYILAYTPYPNGQNIYENPSVLFSVDGKSWTPYTVSNPIEPWPGTGYFNADSELVYLNGKFYMYFAWHRLYPRDSKEKVKISSDGGVTWSESEFITSFWTGDGSFLVVDDHIRSYGLTSWDSPQPFWGLYDSVDGKNFNFIGTTNIEHLPNNSPISHLTVKKLSNGQYWATWKDDSKGYPQTEIYFGISSDGLTFTKYAPILKGNPSGWDPNLYKSTFIVEDGKFELWYAGFQTGIVCHIGYVEATVPNLDTSVYSLNIIKDGGPPPTPPIPPIPIEWLGAIIVFVPACYIGYRLRQKPKRLERKR
jgi:hypothetical protein